MAKGLTLPDSNWCLRSAGSSKTTCHHVDGRKKLAGRLCHLAGHDRLYLSKSAKLYTSVREERSGKTEAWQKRKWGTAKKTKWRRGEMFDLIYPAHIAKIYVARTSNKSDEI